MSESPQTPLLWEGESTLAELHELIRRRGRFELQLPADFHFAIVRHLYPHAAAADPSLVDESGGPELLQRIAEIRGLNELAILVAPLAAAGAQLRVLSPAPAIAVQFPPAT